jgi:2-keto-4-pentenoate hydratase
MPFATTAEESMTITTTPLREAADRLIAAAAAPRQCDPVRDILGDRDIAAAYAVQQLLTEHSLSQGRRIVGHKIGLTSPAVQRQLGVDQPDSGVLFADMQVLSGATVPTDTLLQPKVEAEIAFVLAEDLDGDLSESRLRAAAGVAVPAIEIVDSRVRDWSVSIVDKIADKRLVRPFRAGVGSDRRCRPRLHLSHNATHTGRRIAVRWAGFGLPWQPAQRAAVACPHRPGERLSPTRGTHRAFRCAGPYGAGADGQHVYGRDRRNRFGRALFRGGDQMTRTKVAVIGSGNIGTDLMFKVLRLSEELEMGAMVGIDPDSDGLRRAQRLGVPTAADGVRGLLDMPEFDDIAVVFDATSASAYIDNAKLLRPHGKTLVDLTPAAVGPFVVPAVNLNEHLGSPNVNMVTCGGQATIPATRADQCRPVAPRCAATSIAGVRVPDSRIL